MPQLKCPTCGNEFEAATSRTLPFCSARCKQIDLGRWLDERQTLPYVRPLDEDDDGEGHPIQGDDPAD